MIAPGEGGRVTHFQDILDYGMNTCIRVAPEVMEDSESIGV